MFAGASVSDIGPGRVAATRHDGSLVVRADRIVIATGARELFLPFPGWTLPNVFGVGGAQALLKSGTSFAGKRVIVAGAGPLVLPVTASLARAGARVSLVAERASTGRVLGFAAGLWRRPKDLWQAARYRAAFASTRYAWGTWVVGAAGEGRVREVTLTDGSRQWTERCDVLCVAAGLVPNVELPRLAGCETRDGAVVVNARLETSALGVHCAGEPLGIGGVEVALVEGALAGLAAAGEFLPRALLRSRERGREYAKRLDAAFGPTPEWRVLPPADTIVCRCEDVTLGALVPGWSARQAKLYTRAGMGACQGRVCGAALQAFFGWSPDTVRPPLVPTPIASLVSTLESFDATP